MLVAEVTSVFDQAKRDAGLIHIERSDGRVEESVTPLLGWQHIVLGRRKQTVVWDKDFALVARYDYHAGECVEMGRVRVALEHNHAPARRQLGRESLYSRVASVRRAKDRNRLDSVGWGQDSVEMVRGNAERSGHGEDRQGDDGCDSGKKEGHGKASGGSIISTQGNVGGGCTITADTRSGRHRIAASCQYSASPSLAGSLRHAALIKYQYTDEGTGCNLIQINKIPVERSRIDLCASCWTMMGSSDLQPVIRSDNTHCDQITVTHGRLLTYAARQPRPQAPPSHGSDYQLRFIDNATSPYIRRLDGT